MPIIAIGVIIAIAVQSNLAHQVLHRDARARRRDAVGVAAVRSSLGCIVLGMGLPTVAAYVIGAILFVPALQQARRRRRCRRISSCCSSACCRWSRRRWRSPPTRRRHRRRRLRTRPGWIAFKLSACRAFLIPIAFVRDPAILSGDGHAARSSPSRFVSMTAATFCVGWCSLEGYLNGAIGWPERLAHSARHRSRSDLRAARAPGGCARGAAPRSPACVAGAGRQDAPPQGGDAKARRSRRESRWFADPATGRRIRQVTAHPSHPPPPVLLRAALRRRDAAAGLRLASDRRRRSSSSRTRNATRAGDRPAGPRRLVDPSLARRPLRRVRRRDAGHGGSTSRRCARSSPGRLRRGRDAREGHGRRRDGHDRALARRPLVGGAGQGRAGDALRA